MAAELEDVILADYEKALMPVEELFENILGAYRDEKPFSGFEYADEDAVKKVAEKVSKEVGANISSELVAIVLYPKTEHLITSEYLERLPPSQEKTRQWVIQNSILARVGKKSFYLITPESRGLDMSEDDEENDNIDRGPLYPHPQEDDSTDDKVGPFADNWMAETGADDYEKFLDSLNRRE